MNFFANKSRLAPTGGFFGTGVVVFLFIACAAVLISFVQYALHKAWCGTRPANAYEHFQDKSVDEINAEKYLEALRQRSKLLTDITEVIESDLEMLDDNADETCDITKTIEDNFVMSNSVSSDPNEASLSPERQAENMKKREARALERFRTMKSLYPKVNKTAPLYECFADTPEAVAEDPVAEAESELRGLVESLEILYQTAEFKASVNKWFGVGSLLLFNGTYLKKVADSITEGFEVATTKPILTGEVLLKQADVLFAQGVEFHKNITAQRAIVEAQRNIRDQIFNKGKAIQSGNITEADVAAGQRAKSRQG